MEEADRLCHRVALMDQGRIVTIGEPDQLKLALGSDATMEDVFVQHAGAGPESTLTYREIHRTRETAKRLG